MHTYDLFGPMKVIPLYGYNFAEKSPQKDFEGKIQIICSRRMLLAPEFKPIDKVEGYHQL